MSCSQDFISPGEEDYSLFLSKLLSNLRYFSFEQMVTISCGYSIQN